MEIAKDIPIIRLNDTPLKKYINSENEVSTSDY